MRKTKQGGISLLVLYPHAESNRNRQNRNLKFYPLNYRGRYAEMTANILQIYTKMAIHLSLCLNFVFLHKQTGLGLQMSILHKLE